ncbi:MAG: hypothetical protein ABLQ96_02345 [Candidatus Acidiferrum sp.]
MKTHLRHNHEALLQSVLAGKLPRNLSWGDVLELIAKVGEVQKHGGDEFAFVVGSQRAFFRRPHSDDMQVEDVSRLRKLLHDAGLNAVKHEPHQPGRIVVAIDHHAARLYQDFGGSGPESETTVKPADPHGFRRHLIHRKEANYQGERVPEDTSFYEQVASQLVDAKQIILVGHGVGKSSAVEFLGEYLKKQHPTVHDRVIATEIVDLSALTEPEIEAIAKRYI